MRSFLCLLLMCASTIALAQTTGTIQGRVVDDSGEPLPGVTVVIESDVLLGTQTDVTRADGSFLFRRIPPGLYTVTSTLTGLATDKRQVQVNLSATARPQVTMRPEATAEQLTVTASANPVLDNVEVAAQVTANRLNKLPTATRGQADIARLAPGVTFNGGTGAASISGANNGANTWLINGADSRFDNIRSQPGDAIIEDSISETTVMTAGISAEFGQFTGGVVSTVTKSGGNEFSGSLRFALNNPAWTSNTPIEDADGIDRESTINDIPSLTIGGPIIKDRLWFFVAAQQSEQVRASNYLAPTPITDRAAAAYGLPTGQTAPGLRPIPGRVDEDERFEGKLTGRLAEGHTLAASWVSRDVTNVNNQRFSFDETTLATRTITRDQLAVTYNGTFSPEFSVELQYTDRESVFVERPIPAHIQEQVDAGADLRIIGTNLRYRVGNRPHFNSAQFVGKPDEPRGNQGLRAQANYFLVTDTLGTHDFSIGYHTQEDTRFADNRQYINDWAFWSDFRFEGETPIPIYSPTSADGRYRSWLIYLPIEVSSMTTSYNIDSAWINDTWTLNDKWRFNIGFRYDANEGFRADGFKSVDDTIVAPRLGATFDLRGDGKHEFTASYSTYGQRIGDAADDGSQAGSVSQGRLRYSGPQTEDYLQVIAWLNQTYGDDFFLDPLNHPNTLAWEADLSVNTLTRGNFDSPNQVFGTLNANGFVEGPISTPKTTEYRIGYSVRLSKGFFKADYITREFDDFYADFTDSRTGITNRGNNDLNVIANATGDLYEKNYHAVQTQWSWRFNRNLIFDGNYTWSQLYGNVEGGTTDGILGTVGSLTVYPEWNSFDQRLPSGNLIGDQRHVANLFLSYTWDTSFGTFDFSLHERFASGTPYSTVFAIDFEDDPAAWGLPAGDLGYLNPPTETTYYVDRGGNRAEDSTETNLGINYSFTFGKIEAFVEFDILNLFNESAVDRGWSLDTTVLSTGVPFDVVNGTPEEGVHYTKGQFFGTADSVPDYQRPRQYRIDLGVRF